MNAGYLSLAALAVIMALVLLLPFSLKQAEEELEAFLLLMGIIAVTVSGRWSMHLVSEALTAPSGITVAVLLAGLLLRRLRPRLRRAVDDIVWLLGPRPAMAGLIFLLGLASCLITSIIAALILSEAVSLLRLGRQEKVRLVVCACYAIGLGSALSPWGGPLSAVVATKLAGPPHLADFLFLSRLLGAWILPAVLLVSVWAVCQPQAAGQSSQLAEDQPERESALILRAGKVYIFVMALVCLGAGLSPLAERAAAVLPDWALFWLNSASAVLDNATLAAAEIGPTFSERQLLCALMGMLLAGGMLIPGNLPNIICAGKLGIRSREYAAVAVPLGVALMAGCFALLMLLG